MSNKYLTKISGLISSVIKPIGSIAGGIAKDVGRSAHLAMGGGFRDAAVAKGVTTPAKLRGISNARTLLKATKPKGGLPLADKAARKAEMKQLQFNRNKAIVKSVGYGGGALYAGNKLLDKVKNNAQEQQYQYY